MDVPEVSVVVIAHSVREELERCFASIDAHADMPVEVILVDNASTDDTREWVRAEHPEVRLVELPENIGAAARDEALPLVRGRYAMFLDSDAALTAGALPAMVEALDERPEWGLIGPRLEYDDGSLQLSCRRFPPRSLPLLRRPPLARLLEDSRPVRHHLMEHDGPLAHPAGALRDRGLPALSQRARAPCRGVRPAHVPRLERRRLVPADVGSWGRSGLLPAGDRGALLQATDHATNPSRGRRGASFSHMPASSGATGADGGELIELERELDRRVAAA